VLTSVYCAHFTGCIANWRTLTNACERARYKRKLADIDERMRKGPLQAKIAQNNQATFETTLEQVVESSKANHMAANAKQLQLGEREAKVENMKGQLNAADSNKEFQLLKDRIAADEQANSVLADEIFEMLEKQDVIEQEVKAAKENVTKATAETERIITKVRGELKQLKEERERPRCEVNSNNSKKNENALTAN